MVVDGTAAELTLEFNADMFHRETARQIAGHFLVRRTLSFDCCANAKHR